VVDAVQLSLILLCKAIQMAAPLIELVAFSQELKEYHLPDGAFGFVVTAVMPGSLAEAAGLKVVNVECDAATAWSLVLILASSLYIPLALRLHLWLAREMSCTKPSR
jgi:hypothetical protein